MDLAKIRQKARQGAIGAPPLNPPQPRVETAAVAPRAEACTPPMPVAAREGDFPASAPATPLLPHLPPGRTVTDPLGIILAGREAAGLGEEQQPSPEEQSPQATDEYEEFLCIRVSDEIYGINIMQIKEIIKPRQVTEVPRAPSFVSGIISLRGIIIPILDMLDRLGLRRESVTGRERVVVVKYGETFTGLLVDEVIQVVRIAMDDFEPAPAVLDGIDREFVAGLGRADNRMIILLNLETITDINLF
ncbi:MAG: chemotaxis protein CheW [Deltaproteobacteria bacterium]|nr:chemotaxis protein CheW [Deltaproteobacteria bacterium]